jgi:hypothetical protein
MSAIAELRRAVRRLRRRAAVRTNPHGDLTKYREDPAGYAHDVLGVQWWGVQVQIAEALLKPPYKVLVLASHAVGKTFLAGGLVNWWYDTRPRDSAVLTTAPTDREVKDLTWRGVRTQRKGRGGFRGEAAPELWDNEGHYAKGISPGRAVRRHSTASE